MFPRWLVAMVVQTRAFRSSCRTTTPPTPSSRLENGGDLRDGFIEARTAEKLLPDPQGVHPANITGSTMIWNRFVIVGQQRRHGRRGGSPQEL